VVLLGGGVVGVVAVLGAEEGAVDVPGEAVGLPVDGVGVFVLARVRGDG